MKTFPSIPRADDAPEGLFEEGHLWILEKVDGAHFRFRLEESGRLRFGDRNRSYDDADAVPEPYRHAVRHVRERLDRNALRAAVDDVESVVFFGEATHRQAIEYDWDRTPSVLGFDVWSADREAFLTPDSVEGIFERLGLEPVNAVERERRAGEFDPDTYEIPGSRWYDGPAEGVVVRNKRGQRAKILNGDLGQAESPLPVDATAGELADRFVTDRRLETVATDLADRDRPVTFETLYERVYEDVVREHHRLLFHDADPVDLGAFRSGVSKATREFVERRQG